MAKPLHRKLFAFAVKQRSRRLDHSGLYVPNSNRGELTRAEDIWVVSAAADCRVAQWKKGQHLLIADAFEADEGLGNFDLWEEHKDDPEFAFIKYYVAKCEGKIKTIIVSEESILGEADDSCIQEDYQW